MSIKSKTSIFRLAAFTIALPAIVGGMLAFSTTNDSQQNKGQVVNSEQGEMLMGLPIDKKEKYSLATGYGERMHPVLHVKKLHTGIDLVANEGVPVVSSADGVVTRAQMAEAWGNIIVVQHDDTYSTSYSHLKSMNIKVGDKVQKGQLIGWVGHTGLSSKDHLHFEIHRNGVALDPIGYLPELK